MRPEAISKKKALRSVQGAVLAVLCGLLLWHAPLGGPWINASYDYLFRFGTHPVTNNVTVVMMDNDAYAHFQQTRGQPWDRALHTQLLNKLADDGCALVVMDCFFGERRERDVDERLAGAMRRQRHVVLQAKQAEVTGSGKGLPMVDGVHPLPPTEPFYSAAASNWGIGFFRPDLDLIVRRDWPLPSPGPYPSLSQTAARVEGARWNESPHEQWLRYYSQEGAWTKISYATALVEPTNYFRDQIVFIGNEPQTTSLSDGEADKFSTPYTRWTGETAGGVEIILTSFLNLMNDDWLRRPGWLAEALILVFTGTLLGGGLCRMNPLAAFGCAAACALAVALGAVSCSYFTNYWFPWLVIAGGQVPCAFAWALVFPAVRRAPAPLPGAEAAAAEELPDVPGYRLLPTPFARGSYGKVWLARNPAGEWRAVKIVYLKNFNEDTAPYEREFSGVSRYRAISDQHPSLLRVDFVSVKFPAHFYYVMELGDSLEPGWEQHPSTYKPRDLGSEKERAPGGRLRTRECVSLGLELSDALDFLHRQGLTHRDIKPQNVIFVNGRPKLADLGLISEIRPFDLQRTLVGTPGYMPPPPERPGTPQADIYALGVLLYVLSTGSNPASFPAISTNLAGNVEAEEFFLVNTVILKACQPDPAQRYASALEMHHALQKALEALESGSTGFHS